MTVSMGLGSRQSGWCFGTSGGHSSASLRSLTASWGAAAPAFLSPAASHTAVMGFPGSARSSHNCQYPPPLLRRVGEYWVLLGLRPVILRQISHTICIDITLNQLSDRQLNYEANYLRQKAQEESNAENNNMAKPLKLDVMSLEGQESF